MAPAVKRKADDDFAELLTSKYYKYAVVNTPSNMCLLTITPFKHDFTKSVTVLIVEGDSRVSLIDHAKTLCSHSEYFKTACAWKWPRNGSRPIVLPPWYDPNIFQLYLVWLYAGRDSNLVDHANDLARYLTKDSAPPKVTQQPTSDFTCFVRALLVQAWILGDFITDVEFENKAMDGILSSASISRELMPGAELRSIFAHTRRNSGLQRWAVDHIAALATTQTIDKLKDQLFQDDMAEVMKRMVALRDRGSPQNGVPTDLERAKYHDK
jgi:hypothetical protein